MLRGLKHISVKRFEIFFNTLDRIFGWNFGIRPEWGRDGRTGRTDGPDGTDGWDGRTGRTGWTDGNTVLEYCCDGEIQFCSTTGTEKYSFTVRLGQRIEKYFGPKYLLTVIFFNLLNPV